MQLREGCKAIQNVVQLAPRKAPYEAASDAYLSGRPKLCLSLLHGHDSASASLLRARAFLRAGRVVDAIVELGQNVPSFGDHAASAVHQFLLGTALARRDDYETADEALANAETYATSTGDREIITEAAYYRALTAFMRGDFSRTEDIAGEALDERGGSAHARLLDLLGLVAALQGDIERQITMQLAANEHAIGLAKRDAYFEANMLNNLAIPVAEVNPSGLADFVRTRAAGIAWNDELRPLRFYLTNRLAWLDALAGNHLSAFRNFRLAIDLAPTAALRATALVGRGYLAREIGEFVNAAECIADADDLVQQIDWTATSDDEREALLDLAPLLARSDPSRAALHIARYKALSKPINRLNVVTHGSPLYRAKEAYAFGLVAKEERGVSFALPLLQEAYRLFRSVSSSWRAALVALDLFELTGDAAMLTFARLRANRVPHSWLARRVARLTESSDLGLRYVGSHSRN